MEKKKVLQFLRIGNQFSKNDLREVKSISRVGFLIIERASALQPEDLKYNPYFDLDYGDGEVIRVVDQTMEKVRHETLLQQKDRTLKKKLSKQSYAFALKERTKVVKLLKSIL